MPNNGFTLTFPRLAHEWLKHEHDTELHRKAITVASGAGQLLTGSVLGKVTASGKYVLWDPAANDGSQNFAGFLLNIVDATASDQQATAVLGFCVINAGALTWKAGVTDAQKATLLAAIEASAFVQSRNIA